MDRRTFVKATGVAGIAGLAGCSGGQSEGSDGSDDGVTIGMVYALGGLGDGSFNDQAQSGVIQAEEDFGISYNESQPEEASQFSSFQQQFAQSGDPDYDLVCCIGFLQADSLTESAESFPDQDFMIVDSVVESSNVASYTFKEHEGSYLAGLMASLLTTQDFSAGAGSTDPDSVTLGFVGGVESDLIKRFQAGFEAGVAAGNEDAEVLTNYTGSFNDPAAGREAASAMYDNGADIVFHASGNTGTGVFQAAQEAGRFAVGVDRAQSITRDSYADVILGSMIKRVDTPVYNSIEAKTNGEFPGGEAVSLGLAEEGVGLVYGDSLGSEIPEGSKDQVVTAREEIINGDISVPMSPQ